jgi:CheY-like chemotaxis protein
MKPLVLVVDDTPANLLKNHYAIRVANSGTKALELAQIPIPDAILLDVMMPNMGGWTVCERLKCIEKTAYIPVIFLTAKNSSRMKNSASISVRLISFPNRPSKSLKS